MFVASTAYNGRKATAVLLDANEPARSGWVIRDSGYWSFHDPRGSSCREIVDLDQVEAIDTEQLAFHDNVDEENNFVHLPRDALKHQVRQNLSWNKDRKLLYFRALDANMARNFAYDASKKKTDADVVNVVKQERRGTR